MRFNRLQGVVLAVMLLMVGGFVVNNLTPVAHAQSATTGAIGGEVKDPSGAVVPNATVTVINTGTNATQVIKTNAEGRFTASQLNPGVYKVSATAANLQSSSIQIEVLIGTTVTADVKVSPKGNKDTIEVTASTLPLVDTQNVALATTFNEDQIALLPAPGGDVTTVAFTAPGVVVNAGGSYGNFSANGLPGISNLFVLNGFDNQDPFLNLNNSGSSNLTLGQGELAEATVIENGYNSQYGRAAGVTIAYTTKSGSNAFHGEADYNYNGTALNANGWFFNHTKTPRPHAVSNEWAANVGGRIIKDKLFFFVDYEGLNYVLPGGAGYANFPSPALASFAQANYAANGVDPGLLNQALNLYTSSPAYSSAKPIADNDGGCGGSSLDGAPAGALNTYFGSLPEGATGTVVPCMLQTFGSANNINKEWLNTDRIDWQINDRHRIFGRYKMDRGSQPTYTNFVSPLFNTVSIQPSYEGQFNDSYAISPTKTNTFVMAANWYTAYFGPASIAASQALLPWFYYTDYGLDGTGDGNSSGLGQLGVPYYFPQGRNVTQYQFQDDFSWIHGKHALKFGANFRRDLLSVYDAQANTDFPLAFNSGLSSFADGSIANGSYFQQNYITDKTAHIGLYNFGIYAQDEWQTTSNLKLTLGLRVDHTGNPSCKGGCFGEYAAGTFPSSSASITQPYNIADGGSINPNLNNAFHSQDAIVLQPRFGFNYSIDEKTEIRGGVGFFADLYPAVIMDPVVQNFPNDNLITTYSGNLDSPSVDPNSVQAIATGANGLLVSGFSSGGTLTSINNSIVKALGVPFTPPQIGAYFNSKWKTPSYLEYNLQLQREISKNAALIINYTGNYGYHEMLQNPWLNAGTGFFDGAGVADGTWSSLNGITGSGPTYNPTIAGVPVTPADPSFSRINAYTNDGHSNFNGAWIAVKINGHGLQTQFTYNYGHSLDEISNAGAGSAEPYNTGSSTGQLTPSLTNYNLNYSNSDYDIRHSLTGDFVYADPYKSSNVFATEILGGWTLSGKVYVRSGQPFTLTNSALAGDSFQAMGPAFMVQAQTSTGQLTNTCGKNPHGAVSVPCLNANEYVDPGSQGTLGNMRRNSLYGTDYKNVDLSLTKSIFKHERMDFRIGANAYNILNNVNFAAPGSGLGSSTFGAISGTLSPPTSPYGSFQGNGVTQRLLQVHGKFIF